MKKEITHKGGNDIYVLYDAEGKQLFEGDEVQYKLYPKGGKHDPVTGIGFLKRPHKGMAISYCEVNGVRIQTESTFKKDKKGRSIIRTRHEFEDIYWGFKAWVKKV